MGRGNASSSGPELLSEPDIKKICPDFQWDLRHLCNRLLENESPKVKPRRLTLDQKGEGWGWTEGRMFDPPPVPNFSIHQTAINPLIGA
ncbi:hypothetical protein CEXT_685061 [Caerostris extrusa]|uniref:Uncharacterized protein n=1 Tax=Caerostris extrusa TaxID=172846 RepID=A0AAV4V1H8_CAEEX|nr:hypothetical protein CEXT_685061 [Caerostris extrusa]